MADDTTGIPQDTAPAQDLQINLAESPIAPIEPETLNLQPSTDLNLDLDLNLSDAPKDDNRLKTEDQKNNAVITEPVVETVVEPIAEVIPVIQEIPTEVQPAT